MQGGGIGVSMSGLSSRPLRTRITHVVPANFAFNFARAAATAAASMLETKKRRESRERGAPEVQAGEKMGWGRWPQCTRRTGMQVS